MKNKLKENKNINSIGIKYDREGDSLYLIIKEGAEAIILGCTEISLLSIKEEASVPLIDPLQILAEKVVKKARLET